MRKRRDENRPATIRDVQHIVKTEVRKAIREDVQKIVTDAIADTVRQVIEYVGIIHDKLDTKIDAVDSKLSQELYETKVELKNEIRGLRTDHDSRLTRLEAGKLIT